MASCPSASVLRHCPDGNVHMRLRGWGRGHAERCSGDEKKKATCVAHVHESVERARDDERSVPVEMHGGHIIDMGVQRFGASTCIRGGVSDSIRTADPAKSSRPTEAKLAATTQLDAGRTLGRIPNLHVTVTPPRHELRALSVVVDAEHVAGMALEDSTGQALRIR